jgi:hypothetical protein
MAHTHSPRHKDCTHQTDVPLTVQLLIVNRPAGSETPDSSLCVAFSFTRLEWEEQMAQEGGASKDSSLPPSITRSARQYDRQCRQALGPTLVAVQLAVIR